VAGGASFGALLMMNIAPAAAVSFLVPAASFAFATLAVALIYALARFGRSVSPASLILAGVTMNLIFAAGILAVQYLSDPYQTVTMIRWLMGGVDVDSLGKVAVVAIASGVAAVYTFFRSRALNLLSLGEITAAHLGVETARLRVTLLAAASIIAAAVVAYAGPIGFVGLIVPHMIRRLAGPDHRILLPASALAGASFLVVCDTIARTAFAPTEIPVGIVTAFLGGPFFLWILFRRL
jgi:iron complex transport system permease protein